MQKTSRLGYDNYIRPTKTFTDSLTKDDIKEKLENYKKVDDVSKIPIGSHVRYIVNKDGKHLFRMGGQLVQINGLPDYVLLSNGKNSWSVQVAGTIFFQKKTEKEVVQEYLSIIEEKDKEIEAKNQQIKELAYHIKELKNQLKKAKA